MESIITTDKLTKEYPSARGRILALNQLTMQVARGEIFGLVGPNGSGKTTTLKLLLGLIFPTRGKAEILGQDTRNIGTKQHIGFLPDGPYFYGYLNADEMLQFYGSLFDIDRNVLRARIDDLLDLVGLKEFRALRIAHYSKGMMQRIGLAQAIINDPDLLLLDEPLSGLDPIGAREMKDVVRKLRERGKTVFLCSHMLSDVQALCDSVAILHRGNLIRFGKVADLIGNQGETLEDVFVKAVKGESQ